MKNQILGPSRVVPPFGPIFCFFSYFVFLPVFVFFLAFYFSFFHFFVHFFIFDFYVFSFSFFHFSEEKVSLFFSCISFKYFLLLALVSEVTVSSVVGAPWRCGVPDDIGGIAGIGLGPPCLGESMLQLPRVGWRLLAC